MLISVIEQVRVVLPLILATYLVFSLLKLPDFSLESAYLCGAVAACLTKELPIPFVVLSSLTAGVATALGVVTLHRYFNISYLVSAVIMNGLWHGVTQYLLGESFVVFNLELPIEESFFISAISLTILIVVGLLLRSQLGYSLAVYGSSPNFFSQHGISGTFILVSGVILAHMCASLGGFLAALSNGFVDLTMHFGIILLCLTVVMVGRLGLRRSLPKITVPLLGTVAYFTLQQLLLRTGLDLKYFPAFEALMLFGILLMQRQQPVLNERLEG